MFYLIVGNIGRIHNHTSSKAIELAYELYVSKSKNAVGRAAGENVTLMEDDNIIKEYIAPTMKTPIAIEIINHGVEYSQYFQGCGIAFTDYTDIATGIGSSDYEAFEDALEMLAQSGDWDIEAVEKMAIDQYGEPSKENAVPDDSEDCHVYISIRVK